MSTFTLCVSDPRAEMSDRCERDNMKLKHACAHNVFQEVLLCFENEYLGHTFDLDAFCTPFWGQFWPLPLEFCLLKNYRLLRKVGKACLNFILSLES